MNRLQEERVDRAGLCVTNHCLLPRALQKIVEIPESVVEPLIRPCAIIEVILRLKLMGDVRIHDASIYVVDECGVDA